MQTGTNFDPEDLAIVANLTPEGAEPGTDPAFGVSYQVEEGERPAAPTPAPVAAAPMPSEPPAAPVPVPTPEPTAAPVAAAPVESPAPTAPPAVPQDDEKQHAGNLRNALRAARHDAKRKDDRIKELEAQLATQREQGGNGDTDDGGDEDPLTMSEERLAEIERDFPLQGKTIRTLRALHSSVATRAPAPAPATDWVPPVAPPVVQEVIDQVPQLLAWQLSQADQPKFELATRYDDVLRADPTWKSKPVVERFAEAARRAATHFGAPAPAPAAAAADRIANTPAAPAVGISDFRGGGPANPPQLDYSKMSDQAILASLPVQD